MATTTVELTEELASLVAVKIESGRYEDAGEVIRAALHSLERDENDRERKLTNLRAAIDQGDASGEAADGVFERVRQFVGTR